jgi:hypothetical protein
MVYSLRIFLHWVKMETREKNPSKMYKRGLRKHIANIKSLFYSSFLGNYKNRRERERGRSK